MSGAQRYRDPTANWQSTECNMYLLDYCYANDFRNLKGFENTDITGLSTNLAVSGVSLVNPDTSEGKTSYLPLKTDSGIYMPESVFKDIPGNFIPFSQVGSPGYSNDCIDGITYSSRVFNQPSSLQF